MPRTLQDKITKQKLRKNQEKKKLLLEEDGVPAPLPSSCNGTTDTTFESIKHLLSPQVLKAVDTMGFKRLTEIQRRVVTSQLTSDQRPCVKAIAKTGSGKTLAYLLPLVEMVRAVNADDSTGTLAMVICPTRELALQTYGVATDLLQFCSQKVALVRGGGSKKDEGKVLYWGASILIGTPGRLLDHLQSTEGFIYRNFVSLVIDEADRLFEMGFQKDTNKILSLLGSIRPHQTMLFSATDTPKVEELSSAAFHSTPLTIDLTDEQATVSQLQQEFILCPSEKRFFLLYCILVNLKSKKSMVFVNSRYSIQYYKSLLKFLNIEVIAIHGHQTQEQRNKAFNAFNRRHTGVLMCTDIAARGWDIPVVDCIIQYDPPDDPREYIHRVGRTARGGREGKAYVFLRESEFEFVNFMRAHKVNLSQLVIDWNKAEECHSEPYNKLVEMVHRNGFMKQVANTAFRNYIRSYLSHKVKYIYSKKNIDMQKIAEGFILLKPPFTEIDEACNKPKLKKRHFNDNKPYFADKLNKNLNNEHKAYFKQQSYKKKYSE